MAAYASLIPTTLTPLLSASESAATEPTVHGCAFSIQGALLPTESKLGLNLSTLRRAAAPRVARVRTVRAPEISAPRSGRRAAISGVHTEGAKNFRS